MFQYYSLFNPEWILEKKGLREGMQQNPAFLLHKTLCSKLCVCIYIYVHKNF